MRYTVFHSMNTLAFERLCIRAGCVPLPRHTKKYDFGRAPCRSGAEALSVHDRTHGKEH